MEIIEWWPKLDHRTREWLVAHNGEALSPDVLERIIAAGGAVTSNAGWIGENGPDGFYLSDQAVDWIEAAANDESV